MKSNIFAFNFFIDLNLKDSLQENLKKMIIPQMRNVKHVNKKMQSLRFYPDSRRHLYKDPNDGKKEYGYPFKKINWLNPITLGQIQHFWNPAGCGTNFLKSRGISGFIQIFIAPPPVGVDYHDAPFWNWHDLANKKYLLVKFLAASVWPQIIILTDTVLLVWQRLYLPSSINSTGGPRIVRIQTVRSSQ